MKTTNYLAALVLFLTPAISVELLSGNTPLAAYLMPIAFITLNITYGGALLLIRETVARWGKGFASVLMLAAGYGMLNEAVGTKGFFDPRFYAVVSNGLEGFGRFFGINVPWALNISIFHAVFSILVPLTLVSALFPGSGRWIGNKLYTALLAVLVADTTFIFKMFSMPPYYYHYDEGFGPILLILALMAAVVLAAWKMPEAPLARWNIRRPHALLLFFIGAVYVLAFFITSGIIRNTTQSPAAYIAFLLIAFVAVPVWLVLKLPEPTARGKVALAAGLLAPMVGQMSWIGTVSGNPGVIAAAIFVIVLIVVAWLRAGRAAV